MWPLYIWSTRHLGRWGAWWTRYTNHQGLKRLLNSVKQDTVMASPAVRRMVTVLIILTISICLYMRQQHLKKAGWVLRVTPLLVLYVHMNISYVYNVTVDLDTIGWLMLIYFGLPVWSVQQFWRTPSEESKDKKTEEGTPESALDDNEELITIEKAERVTKNSVQLTTKDIELQTDGNETMLIPHTPERSVGSDPETLIPLLNKKDFRKLPQWDFEDVYTRNDQPRQMVCSWILSIVKLNREIIPIWLGYWLSCNSRV